MATLLCSAITTPGTRFGGSRQPCTGETWEHGSLSAKHPAQPRAPCLLLHGQQGQGYVSSVHSTPGWQQEAGRTVLTSSRQRRVPKAFPWWDRAG